MGGGFLLLRAETFLEAIQRVPGFEEGWIVSWE
jgi:hypothetical protein